MASRCRLLSRQRSGLILLSALVLVLLCVAYAYNTTPLTQTIPDVVTSPTGQRTSLLKKSNGLVVPNLVHFVWFGADVKLRFHHFLSIRSAYKILKPEKIMFHCDHEPVGKWWKKVKGSILSLITVKRTPPSEIYGNAVIRSEHKSDIARIEILQEHGGIYMDCDVIALKSFDPLRQYSMTMGIEYHGAPGRLNNGVILSSPNATFMTIWKETYKNFTKREWDYHDSVIPYNLQFQFPSLIHVEENTLNYPSGKDKHLIYNGLFDWSRNYAMHLWYRLYDIEHGPSGIRKMNTTFGEIARYIYYGNKTIFK